MAKTYTWNKGYGRIDVAGGTSSDPVTFKNITDYYEANPLLNDFNMPRTGVAFPAYGGVPYIVGDSATFTGVAGDKIKVTYEGTVYDNIDVSACTTIANVVTAINNALPGSPASAQAGTGYLLIRCDNNIDGAQVVGDVAIDDGSGTSSPCVARLFSVSGLRDSSSFDFPYELTEGNASNWFGIGGLATPTDDTTAYTKGYKSVTAAVSSVPTGTNITRVNCGSTNIVVYMADTSAFALHDEVKIVGTTNFGGIIFRITSISNNVYVCGYTPRDTTIVDETGISGATLIKPLTLAWNNTYAVAVGTIKSVSLANKIRISAKSDGAGTPKIVGVIVRNYYGAGTPANFYYGATYKADWTLTSAWQDFEIDIRTQMKNYQWPDNSSARGYWSTFAKFYIMFDGLSVGENVWIDGVRFTLTDRNPKRAAESNYTFPVGLNIPSGCWFKDFGFNVRFDVLESSLMINTYEVLTAIAANVGELDFGDYGGTEKEGGVFIFNAFSQEDNGYGVRLVKTRCQGITFKSFKNQYGGFTFNSYCTGNLYRNCNWINMLNFFGTENLSTFENCSYMGGRYFMAFPPAGITINKFTCYGVSTANPPFFVRANYSPISVKGVKIIDATANKRLINADNYSSAAGKEGGIRLINFDISECASTCNMRVERNYAVVPQSTEHFISFSFNLKVTDVSGNAISGATVQMTNKNGTQLFSTTTDANGIITEQTIDILRAYYCPVSTGGKIYYFDTPTVDWEYYYPFSLTISKSGYETYTDTILKGGYSRTDEICKNGYNGKVALKRSKATRMDLAGNVYINLDKANTGKKISLLGM